jgi:hypothetical protein
MRAHHTAVAEILARYRVDVAIHHIAATEIELHRRYGAMKPCFVLIRPDGHVATRAALPDVHRLTAHMDMLYTRARAT